MTLYRIKGFTVGLDYWERAKELGFVEADSKTIALDYARTLQGFVGHTYDDKETEGSLEVITPFIGTPDHVFNRIEEFNKKVALENQKRYIEQQLAEVNAALGVKQK